MNLLRTRTLQILSLPTPRGLASLFVAALITTAVAVGCGSVVTDSPTTGGVAAPPPNVLPTSGATNRSAGREPEDAPAPTFLPGLEATVPGPVPANQAFRSEFLPGVFSSDGNYHEEYELLGGVELHTSTGVSALQYAGNGFGAGVRGLEMYASAIEQGSTAIVVTREDGTTLTLTRNPSAPTTPEPRTFDDAIPENQVYYAPATKSGVLAFKGGSFGLESITGCGLTLLEPGRRILLERRSQLTSYLPADTYIEDREISFDAYDTWQSPSATVRKLIFLGQEQNPTATEADDLLEYVLSSSMGDFSAAGGKDGYWVPAVQSVPASGTIARELAIRYSTPRGTTQSVATLMTDVANRTVSLHYVAQRLTSGQFAPLLLGWDTESPSSTAGTRLATALNWSWWGYPNGMEVFAGTGDGEGAKANTAAAYWLTLFETATSSGAPVQSLSTSGGCYAADFDWAKTSGGSPQLQVVPRAQGAAEPSAQKMTLTLEGLSIDEVQVGSTTDVVPAFTTVNGDPMLASVFDKLRNATTVYTVDADYGLSTGGYDEESGSLVTYGDGTWSGVPVIVASTALLGANGASLGAPETTAQLLMQSGDVGDVLFADGSEVKETESSVGGARQDTYARRPVGGTSFVTEEVDTWATSGGRDQVTSRQSFVGGQPHTTALSANRWNETPGGGTSDDSTSAWQETWNTAGGPVGLAGAKEGMATQTFALGTDGNPVATTAYFNGSQVGYGAFNPDQLGHPTQIARSQADYGQNVNYVNNVSFDPIGQLQSQSEGPGASGENSPTWDTRSVAFVDTGDQICPAPALGLPNPNSSTKDAGADAGGADADADADASYEDGGPLTCSPSWWFYTIGSEQDPQCNPKSECEPGQITNFSYSGPVADTPGTLPYYEAPGMFEWYNATWNACGLSCVDGQMIYVWQPPQTLLVLSLVSAPSCPRVNFSPGDQYVPPGAGSLFETRANGYCCGGSVKYYDTQVPVLSGVQYYWLPDNSNQCQLLPPLPGQDCDPQYMDGFPLCPAHPPSMTACPLDAGVNEIDGGTTTLDGSTPPGDSGSRCTRACCAP